MSRREDLKLKKLIAAISDDEAAVNIRLRWRKREPYLVGFKRNATMTAKRTVKLLHELGILSAALLILTAASEPRLFACFKPNKAWSDNLSKKQCLKQGGRWLPKGDDMPIPGTRA